MEESEAGKDRLQKTKDGMDYRTSKAGEDMIENEKEAAPESNAKKTEVNTGAIIESDDMDEDQR